MILRNVDLLLGEELAYAKSADIGVSGGRFQTSGMSGRRTDCEGLLMIPGLVNAHTHVGDSIAKDAALGKSTEDAVHPVFGIKRKVLSNTDGKHLTQIMRAACASMIRKGITTFVDFREGGAEGVALLKNAVRGLGIRAVILGRLEQYHDAESVQGNAAPQRGMLDSLVRQCDGIGISGANENSDRALKYYSRTPKIRAIHAAETKESIAESLSSSKRSEVSRALALRPHFVVHMTHASKAEIKAVSKKTRGIVVCPRSNGALAGGVPDIRAMLDAGCAVAIGTDNVMINSPDILREMDYIWKCSMGLSRSRIDPRTILKMGTVNASKILDMDIGVIRHGAAADAVFVEKRSLDLEPMHNPHAAIVHRVSESSIRAVMINGRIVHGRI